VIDADLILTMTCLQRDTLRRQVPSKAGDIFTLKEYLGVNTCEKKDSFSDSQTGRHSAIWGNPFDIHDPFGSTIDIYQEILDEIEECISALLEKLSLEV
jgi:ribose 5-phosphate isomerase B